MGCLPGTEVIRLDVSTKVWRALRAGIPRGRMTPSFLAAMVHAGFLDLGQIDSEKIRGKVQVILIGIQRIAPPSMAPASILDDPSAEPAELVPSSLAPGIVEIKRPSASGSDDDDDAWFDQELSNADKF